MKNYLITGVSRGLGLKIAETLLADESVRVWGIGRSRTDGIGALGARFGDRFNYLRFDLADAGRVRSEVFGGFYPAGEPLSGLVNNAAVAYADLATNLKLAPLENMFAVNVYSAMFLADFAIRNMILHGVAGSIVNISSVCAGRGYKGLSMYAATKGALEAFSKNISREWGRYGIRSNCVAAGFMDTDMSSPLSAADRAKIAARSSLKREVSVESVAAAVKFLLSPESASITGEVVRVDAGA